MSQITQIPKPPPVVGVTLCSDWFSRRGRRYEVPVHEKPGQKEEILYWYDQASMDAYLAGEFALPVCPACGREGTKCSQDRSLPCDPVPGPPLNRGTGPRHLWHPAPVSQ